MPPPPAARSQTSRWKRDPPSSSSSSPHRRSWSSRRKARTAPGSMAAWVTPPLWPLAPDRRDLHAAAARVHGQRLAARSERAVQARAAHLADDLDRDVGGDAAAAARRIDRQVDV